MNALDVTSRAIPGAAHDPKLMGVAVLDDTPLVAAAAAVEVLDRTPATNPEELSTRAMPAPCLTQGPQGDGRRRDEHVPPDATALLHSPRAPLPRPPRRGPPR